MEQTNGWYVTMYNNTVLNSMKRITDLIDLLYSKAKHKDTQWKHKDTPKDYALELESTSQLNNQSQVVPN